MPEKTIEIQIKAVDQASMALRSAGAAMKQLQDQLEAKNGRVVADPLRDSLQSMKGSLRELRGFGRLMVGAEAVGKIGEAGGAGAAFLSAFIEGDLQNAYAKLEVFQTKMKELPYGIGQAFGIGNAIGQFLFGDQAGYDQTMARLSVIEARAKGLATLRAGAEHEAKTFREIGEDLADREAHDPLARRYREDLRRRAAADESDRKLREAAVKVPQEAERKAQEVFGATHAQYEGTWGQSKRGAQRFFHDVFGTQSPDDLEEQAERNQEGAHADVHDVLMRKLADDQKALALKQKADWDAGKAYLGDRAQQVWDMIAKAGDAYGAAFEKLGREMQDQQIRQLQARNQAQEHADAELRDADVKLLELERKTGEAKQLRAEQDWEAENDKLQQMSDDASLTQEQRDRARAVRQQRVTNGPPSLDGDQAQGFHARYDANSYFRGGVDVTSSHQTGWELRPKDERDDSNKTTAANTAALLRKAEESNKILQDLLRALSQADRVKIWSMGY